jgi:integrase
MIFSQFVADIYLPHAEAQRYRSSSYKSDVRIVTTYFADSDIASITKTGAEDFKTHQLKAVSKRHAQLAPSTINKHLITLKKILKHAKKVGLIKKNPARKVKLLKVQNERERVLSKEEQRRLFPAMSNGSWIKRISTFALHTGMRRGEIVKLKWADVDLKNKSLMVRKSKNGKDRRIPLNSKALQVLSRCNQKRALVFPVKAAHISYAFAKACKRAGIEGLTFHDLRHTFATRLGARGAEIATVNRLLGHGSLDQTKRYMHTLEETMKQAVDLLD